MVRISVYVKNLSELLPALLVTPSSRTLARQAISGTKHLACFTCVSCFASEARAAIPPPWPAAPRLASSGRSGVRSRGLGCGLCIKGWECLGDVGRKEGLLSEYLPHSSSPQKPSLPLPFTASFLVETREMLARCASVGIWYQEQSCRLQVLHTSRSHAVAFRATSSDYLNHRRAPCAPSGSL